MNLKNSYSSDSEDEPLSSKQARQDVTPYDSLVQPAFERCEFCDQEFTTRLSSIQHNASHIIIPLVNLKLHQCRKCLSHFTSLEDLQKHKASKHRKTDPKHEYKEILQSIIKTQVVVKCHDILSEVLCLKPMNHIKEPIRNESPALSTKSHEANENDDNKLIPTYVISSDSESDRFSPKSEHSRLKTENSHIETEQSRLEMEHSRSNILNSPEMERKSLQTEHSQLETEYSQSKIEQSHLQTENSRMSPDSDSDDVKNDGFIGKEFNFSHLDGLSSPSSKIDRSSTDYAPISSRIIFEDDFEEDDLFDSELLVPRMNYTSQNSCIIGKNAPKPNSFILGTQVNTESNVEVFESVHYDDLVKDELCDCCYCGRCFHNRLELVKHESTHMRVRKPRPPFCVVCERYLAGNYRTLRNHMHMKHPNFVGKNIQIRKCKTCAFHYFSYTRHVAYYHQYLPTIENDPEMLSEHYKVIKMCELCLSFLKNKQNLHYEVVGEFSEVGVRQICEKCNTKCFEVNLVRRYMKDVNNLRMFMRKKPMSNKDRLKKMQKRLKMFNKMSKC